MAKPNITIQALLRRTILIEDALGQWPDNVLIMYEPLSANYARHKEPKFKKRFVR